MPHSTLIRNTYEPRRLAFERYLAQGYQALHRGERQQAYAAFENAHVLGQSRTDLHLRSHWAFLRWAVSAGDWPEIAGQFVRLAAATLVTWLWVPPGNTGGARVGAMRTMAIPAHLRPYLGHEGLAENQGKPEMSPQDRW